MFLYELITLLKPFQLVADNPVTLLCKGERPQIPESKVSKLNCYIIIITSTSDLQPSTAISNPSPGKSVLNKFKPY